MRHAARARTSLGLALALVGCDSGGSIDASEGRCGAFGRDLEVGESADDEITCTRCTCHAVGELGCQPLPGCGDGGPSADVGEALADAATRDGAPSPDPPMVLVLVDTSTSMNERVRDRAPPETCAGEGCPPWVFPNCDARDAPETRLGRLKAALRRVFAGEPTAPRAALLRFPQRPRAPAECAGGYGEGAARMSGHGGERETSLARWFGSNLSEIVAVPFDAPAGGWGRALDFNETVDVTGMACETSEDCASGLCEARDCVTVVQPELRADGPSPLGVGLFYAGEYLRHTVLDGATGPVVLLLVVDGGDSEVTEPGDFFHPRVQAKRLRYGLGCARDDACTGGATCVDGVCRPPEGTIDAGAMVCSVLGTPCRSGGECNGATCRAVRIDEDTPRNLQSTVELRVLDLSGIADAHGGVRAYTGGNNLALDTPSTDDLEAAIRDLVSR